MPQLKVQAPPTQRMFIALPVPEIALGKIKGSFSHFANAIEKEVPTNKWHVTVAWLGEVYNPAQYMSRLVKPMPQSFVPTVRVTHVGRGHQRQQLWAYAEASTSLLNIRGQIIDRLKKMRFQLPEDKGQQPFVPHITVAKLYDQLGRIGLADYPLMLSFVAERLLVVRSDITAKGVQYITEGEIILT